jgi:glycosyltransferase involved in cell wall biosynthesis
MKSKKILHFIYGDLAYNNFLYPFIRSDINTSLQDVVIGGKSIDLSVFKSKKGKGLHFGYKFQIRSLRVNFFKIAKLINRRSPSTVVAHMSLYSFYPLMIAKFLGVKKRVYVCHGAPYLGYYGFLRYVLKVLEKINISLSTLTICVSPSIKNELNKISNNINIVSIVPGSSVGLSKNKYLNEDRVIKKIRKRKNSDYLRVLYIGRGNKRKGVYSLLAASKDKRILEKKIKIDIVGFKESETSFKIKGMSKNVTFHGFKHEVSDFYNDNDIVILPSWHEGFGYTLLEGAAYACAMVASDIPGPDSIVSDNVNGRLIQPRSTEQIIKCLLEYYDNRNLLSIHMKNAYKRSLDFEETKIISQFNTFLMQDPDIN